MRHGKLVSLGALGALVLAGCSKQADEAPAGKAVATTPAGIGATPEPVAGASPRTLAKEIPVPIRGRWGLVPADCTSTRGDAKGLVEIDATSLKFYESVAKLETVKDADSDEIVATFGFTGEGQSWTLDVALEVEDDGKTLIRKDTGQDALPGSLRYTRCA